MTLMSEIAAGRAARICGSRLLAKVRMAAISKFAAAQDEQVAHRPGSAPSPQQALHYPQNCGPSGVRATARVEPPAVCRPPPPQVANGDTEGRL